jgi:hypothetical protein
LIAVSLAEAESIRRLIHSLTLTNQHEDVEGAGGAPPPALGLAIRVLESGMVIDRSEHFVDEDEGVAQGEGGEAPMDVKCMLQCLRFYNNDMWYDANELQVHSHTLLIQ